MNNRISIAKDFVEKNKSEQDGIIMFFGFVARKGDKTVSDIDMQEVENNSFSSGQSYFLKRIFPFSENF